MSLTSELLADSPHYLWLLQETSGTNVDDATANNRDGTIGGTNGLTLGVTGPKPGELDRAFSFSGAASSPAYVSRTAAALSGTAISVVAVVKTADTSRTNVWIAGRHASCFLKLESGFPTFTHSRTSGTAYTATSSVSVADGEWHIIHGRTISNAITIWVDGVLAGSVGGAGTLLHTDTSYVGWNPTTGGIGQFNGQVAAHGIFQSGLSQARIEAHADALLAGPPSFTGALAAATQPVVVELAGSYTPPPVTGSLAAELPTVETSVSGSYIAPVTGALGVTFGQVEFAVAGTYEASEAEGSLDASLPPFVFAATGTYLAPVSGTLDAGLGAVDFTVAGTYTPPPVTGSFGATFAPPVVSFTGDAGESGISGSFAVSLPAFGLSLAGTYEGATPTDTSNAADGLIIDGTATWSWTPAIDPPPTGGPGGGGGTAAAPAAFDVAVAFSPVTRNGVTVSYTTTEKRERRLRQRVVINGKDVSYFRGFETEVADYQLLEPFLYGPATIVFPQILAPFEKPGEGALAFLKKGNRVVIENVDDETGTVESVAYKGRVATWNPSGRSLRVELGGEVRGPAASMRKTLPLFPRRRDAGEIIYRMLNTMGVKARPRLGPDTGYILGQPGPGWYLEILERLHAESWTLDGDQWTTMPDANGVYRTKLKDRTTIHGTVYLDDARNVAELRSDITEEPNRVYGTGVTPDGMRINNAVYPGLKQGEVPAFPGSMSQGDSGDDVAVLIQRLKATRYLSADEAPGGFDADVTEAVKELQDDANIIPTGVVDGLTWRALWDLDVTGFSTRMAFIQPLAQRRAVRKWNHSAGGAYTSLNPNYDPARQKVDVDIDFGAHQWRKQMRRRARAMLFSGEEQWVGTIRLNTGAIVAGDHTPGNPIGSILRARDIKPGMNLKLPTLGDIVVHVSGVSIAGPDVTLAVDTAARDSMAVWQVIERNRESRKDPARAWLREYRNSGQSKDSLGEWSEVGGVLGNRVDLTSGKWTVFQVVAGPITGTIRSLQLECGPGVEFSVAVFGRSIEGQRLDNLIGNPLSAEGEERWADPDVREKLENRVILYQAGTKDDPCGYWPKRKSKHGAGIVSGKWYDDASFSYHCLPRIRTGAAIVDEEPLNTYIAPLLWVAVYSNGGGFVRPGRVMWPQAEGGV